jgi:spore maturation protein CgeB
MAEAALEAADAAIVTSYCPDARSAAQLMSGRPHLLRVFYDLDTPVTFGRVERGEAVEYVPPDGLAAFDLVLSFTGGRALDGLKSLLGARRTAPLYGSVDPACHKPVESVGRYAADLSYLGTYAADRQQRLEQLFIGAATKLRDRRFLIGGSLYPREFPWTDNVYFIDHVPPAEHPAFYCSSRVTLNVTRDSMARYGYCPSGRLFEAAACGVPILSDDWEGLDAFFRPGKEVLVARSTEEALQVLNKPACELAEIAAAANARVRSEHTAQQRARELIAILNE